MTGYDMNHVYFYLGVFVVNMLADKIAYRGSGRAGEISFGPLRYALFVSWWLLMLAPLYEYSNFPRLNPAVTAAGTLTALVGTAVRASGIYCLGEFFSAHVETWHHQAVVDKGPYRFIRHPAYAGNILQAVGMPLILNAYLTLLLSAFTISLFLVRLVLEEKVLADKLPGYREYMKRTKRIVPGLW